MYGEEPASKITIVPVDEVIPLAMPAPDKMDWYNKTRKLDANDLVVKLGHEGFRNWVFEQMEKAPVVYRRDTSILSLWEIRTKYPELREPVVDGLLRKAEIMNIIAAPKYGKSVLAVSLAISVAQGRCWLDTFQCHQGRVLIVDNELHCETCAHRTKEIATGMDIPVEYLDQWIDYLPLRGNLVDIKGLKSHLCDIAPGEYKLVVLDAIYKFMPPKTDENNNGEMAAIFNLLDQYAKQLDCAMVLVHHTSKGDQGYKTITDVGAGAGVQSRAADTHLIIREHRDPSLVIVDAVVRSFKTPKGFCARFRYPKWEAAPDGDPTEYKGSVKEERRNEKEQAQKTEQGKVDRVLGAVTSPMTIEEMTALGTSFGLVGYTKYKMRRQVDTWVGSGMIKLVEAAAGRVGAKYQSADSLASNKPEKTNQSDTTDIPPDTETSDKSIPF